MSYNLENELGNNRELFLEQFSDVKETILKNSFPLAKGISFTANIYEVEHAFKIFKQIEATYDKQKETVLDEKKFNREMIEYIKNKYEDYYDNHVDPMTHEEIKIIKAINDWPIETLAFHMADSELYYDLSYFPKHFDNSFKLTLFHSEIKYLHSGTIGGHFENDLKSIATGVAYSRLLKKIKSPDEDIVLDEDTDEVAYFKNTIDENLADLKEKEVFLKREYTIIVNSLCEFFEGKRKTAETSCSVMSRNSKPLGEALGNIYRELKKLKKGMSYEYISFCKSLFECYNKENISGTLYETRLYKYFTSKPKKNKIN